MDNVEMAIQKVCASKVYTSAEFKREKDNFQARELSLVLIVKMICFSHFARTSKEQSQRNG